MRRTPSPAGVMQHDAIVDIPPNRVRFFGTTGKMLLPSPDSLAAIIRSIPPQRLLTTAALSAALAKEFRVQGVCPVTLRKSLQALARDSEHDVPYWRVIRPNGDLPSLFPGSAQAQAERLRAEGMTIDASGKAPRVTAFREHVLPPVR